MANSVAVLLGGNSPEIVKALKREIDNVSFQVFKSVKSLSVRGNQQSRGFDRVVLSPAAIKDINDLEMLHEFVTTISVRTTVVFLLKGGQAKDYHEYFHEYFSSPLYTDMVVQTASTLELKIAVTEEIEDIRKNFSAFKLKEVRILDDTIDSGHSNMFDSSFVVEAPMSRVPNIRRLTFGEKHLNKKVKLSKPERDLIQFNNMVLQGLVGVLGFEGYNKYRNMIEGSKYEFYTKHNLIRTPENVDNTEHEVKKEELDRDDFIHSLYTLISFSKDPNLLASKFVNRVGKPILDNL